MSRKPRNRAKKLPHHTICKSIPERNLYNDNEDKELYLAYMGEAAKIYNIDVLAYCLMDNHVHILVYPQGGDISKFMFMINNRHANEYNKKYERSGTLFASRFKNIIIRDLSHLLRTSTYIHNNAKDLLHKGYKSIKEYPYSSIKDYINPEKARKIASPTYIFNQMGGTYNKVHKHYLTLLEIQMQEHEQFEEELQIALKQGEYITDKETFDRDENPQRVISILEKLLAMEGEHILHTKYRKKYQQFKGIVAATLRIYCDLSLGEMTKYFKGQTSVTIGRLARIGLEEFERKPDLFKQIKEAIQF
jgi:putative transposase